MSDVDQAVAGDRGTRRYVPSRLVIDPAALRRAAAAKTADFSLLTADFGDDRVTFEPWLSLRLVERDRIVSWGAYQLAFPPGEPDDGDPVLPDVAWRRAEWDKSRDRRRLRAAPDKAAYLRGDTQIESQIRFGRLVDLPRLAAAVREGIEIVAGGVVVHAADRPDMVWESLRVSVADRKAAMNLEYAPWVMRCGEVESWGQRWSTLLDELGDEKTFSPDSDITVSYEDSFEALVAETHRFPRPDIDPWLAGVG